MRVTEVVSREAGTQAELYESEYRSLVVNGETIAGIDLWQKVAPPWGRLEVVQLQPGAELGLHGADHLAFCQVVAGKGILELPDDREVPFSAPHMFVFEPGTEHGWRGIEETTVMAIIVVGAEE